MTSTDRASFFSVMLKELGSNCLIHQEEYPQILPWVEYSLFKRGKSLIPIPDAMCDWDRKTGRRDQSMARNLIRYKQRKDRQRSV